MPPTSSSSRGPSSRRRLGRNVSVTIVAVAVVCGVSVAASSTGPYKQGGKEFVTRPDLRPPDVEVLTQPNGTGPGNLITAPIAPLDEGLAEKLETPGQAGAMISDDQGEPIWFKPAKPGTGTMDLQMQEYQGKPVLTWWEGELVVPPGFGYGRGVIMDQAYNEIASVQMGNGVKADIHDFQITPRNTALLLAYQPVPMDLTPFGGPKDGQVLENVVQEVDIATGKVLLDWRSLDHVGLDESYLPLPADPSKEPWDYFHVNSVEEDGPGNLLISARSTHTLYQLNRQNGAVNWRLNGKKTDFAVPPEAQFQWQHDARRMPDGTISIFDNGVAEKLRSRGVVLRVDEQARTAEVVREDWRPAPVVSPNMGNYQMMENGNAMVGWGGAPGWTELGPDKTVRYEAQFDSEVTSYRAYRAEWVGNPSRPPDVVAKSSLGSGTTAYASWNGATELKGWRVLAGDDPENLEKVKDVPRRGFETQVDVEGSPSYVAMQPLDAEGNVIREVEPVKVNG